MSTSNLLSVKPWKIYASVSLSGACVMIFELAGARMIGPYFGTSIYVWTNVIGVILASLSLGYYIGGHRADEQDANRLLASCLGATGLSVLLCLLIHSTVLRNLAHVVSDPRFGGLYASLILFALPSIFFGSISPIATRLMLKSLNETGKVTGKIGAISTIGSLIGTFVGGFILIPYLGVQQVMLSVGVLMLLLSAIFSVQHFLKFAGLGVIIITLHFFFPQAAYGKRYSTLYNDVMIYENVDASGDSIRIMQVNNHIGSAQYLNSDELVYPYLRQFRIDQQLVPGFTHTLTIGGAACSYPRELLMQYDDVTVDVIEIDGKLIELAHSHFDLPYSSRLKTYSQDGRHF
ncbi:MAG: fused MFS/spermidine synthase, partial [Chitinophagales bacterium]